jgi:hypothetical protein
MIWNTNHHFGNNREHQRHRQVLEDKIRRGVSSKSITVYPARAILTDPHIYQQVTLTESEQIALATYRSKDSSSSEEKSCVIC